MPRSPAPPTGRRAGVDREQMVSVALALVVSEGPTALTMRRLALELGVTTTTIYWHVGSREELIIAVVRLQSVRQATEKIVARTPRTRVMAAARHMWDAALDNRAITSLAHQSGTTSVLEAPLERALQRELQAAGLADQQAADALRSILATIGGFLLHALRDESSIPAERRRGTVDLPRLFDQTVQAVIDSYLDTPAVPSGGP